MICPNCKLKLKTGKPKGSNIEIDFCPGCKGIWFQKNEFEKIVQEAIKELVIPKEATISRKLCPDCKGKHLYSFYYPQTFVTIDYCKKCKGFWLDAGELKEIQSVRQNLAQKGQAKDFDDLKGVKGLLTRFIDYAFTNLCDW